MTSSKVLASVPDSKLAHTFSGGLTQLKKVNGEVFLDRNGKIFEAMIDYLRDGRQTMPKFSEFNDQIRFTQELAYWGVTAVTVTEKQLAENFKSPAQQKPVKMFATNKKSLSSTMDNNFRKPKKPLLPDVDSDFSDRSGTPEKDEFGFPVKLQKFLEKEPSDSLPRAKQKWLELGFMKLETIVKNSNLDKDIVFELKLGRDKTLGHTKGQLNK